MDSISIMTISACISIIVAIWTINRDKKNDTRNDAESNVTLREEIKYISRGVEDIKYDTRLLTSNISEINDRLIRVEEKAKSNHEKIEQIKKGESV